MNKKEIISKIALILYTSNIIYYGTIRQCVDAKEYTRITSKEDSIVLEYSQLLRLKSKLNEEGLQLLNDKELECRSIIAETREKMDDYRKRVLYNGKCAFFTKPVVALFTKPEIKSVRIVTDGGVEEIINNSQR